MPRTGERKPDTSPELGDDGRSLTSTGFGKYANDAQMAISNTFCSAYKALEISHIVGRSQDETLAHS